MTNKNILKRSFIPLSLCASSAAWGQAVTTQPTLLAAAPTIAPVQMELKTEPSKNRFTLGYQMGFNIKASFKNIGAFPAATDPGAAVSGVNHLYDDGYNYVDTTGNDHGPGFTDTTWFWGYQNDSQYDAGAGTITMNSASSAGAVSKDRDDDPQPGFELKYNHELFRDSQDRWRWGFESAFGYTDLEIQDSHSLTANVTEVSDFYSIPGGFVPPSAPYNGTFTGPGMVISDVPHRSIFSVAEPVTGSREFDADLFGFRFGPYVEIPLNKNKTFLLTFDGGLAMAYVHSSLRFNELVATPNGVLNMKGNSDNDDVLFGGYIGGEISAALNDQWSVFASARWQDVGNYTHASSTGESAALDLSQSIFFSAGFGFDF